MPPSRAAIKYNPGDKIFAKVKGHPHWPCRDIYPYEQYKDKFGVEKSKRGFNEGLVEINENPDVLLYDKDPEAEVFLARFYSFNRSNQAPQSITSDKKQNDLTITIKPVTEQPLEDKPTSRSVPVTTKSNKLKRSSTSKPEPIISDPPVTKVSDPKPNRRSSLKLKILKSAKGVTCLRPGSPNSVPPPPITKTDNSSIKESPDCQVADTKSPSIPITPPKSDDATPPLSSNSPSPDKPQPPNSPICSTTSAPRCSPIRPTPIINEDSADRSRPPRKRSFKRLPSGASVETINDGPVAKKHRPSSSSSRYLLSEHRTVRSSRIDKRKAHPRADSTVTKTNRISQSPRLPTESPRSQLDQQKQEVDNLNTEARLLLLNRAIKSSLVRGQEDVNACVDRLQAMSRVNVTLPVIAKCWSVVETIRKLELAHAELVKHQEQHSTNASQQSANKQPYQGPKSIADMFSDHHHAINTPTGQSTTPSSINSAKSQPVAVVKQDNFISSTTTTVNLADEDESPESPPLGDKVKPTILLHENELPSQSNQFSVDELLLFDQRPQTNSTEPLPTDEFEVLDEYEEPSSSSVGPPPQQPISGTIPSNKPIYHSINSIMNDRCPVGNHPVIPSTTTHPYSLEITPPQLASRAYVPHSLNPSNEPPPPYRPYIPSNCHVNNNNNGVFDRQYNPSSSYHYSPMKSSSSSNQRARSPHALPHPLEHYQKYLTSALDNNSDAIGNRRPRDQHRYLPPPINHPQPTADQVDDLEARIARVIGEAGSHPNPPPQQPFSPPPPPPPPPPESQYLLFTHRPQMTMMTSPTRDSASAHQQHYHKRHSSGGPPMLPYDSDSDHRQAYFHPDQQPSYRRRSGSGGGHRYAPPPPQHHQQHYRSQPNGPPFRDRYR